MENFERLLSEQLQISFVGKINLLKESGQYLGCLFLKDGYVVGVDYKGLYGISGLRLLSADLAAEIFLRYVVEPEIIKEHQINFEFDFKAFLAALGGASAVNAINDVTELKPPLNIGLKVSSDFVMNGASIEKVDCEQFLVLCAVAEHVIVKEIYENWVGPEQLLTKELIWLRKRKILRVISN